MEIHFRIKFPHFWQLTNKNQKILDIYHPETPNVPKKELQRKLADIFKISDESTISLFGFRTYFGGLKSTGFGFIYKNIESARETEPIFRLLRNNLVEINKTSSKQRKERKNRMKKTRGKNKTKLRAGI